MVLLHGRGVLPLGLDPQIRSNECPKVRVPALAATQRVGQRQLHQHPRHRHCRPRLQPQHRNGRSDDRQLFRSLQRRQQPLLGGSQLRQRVDGGRVPRFHAYALREQRVSHIFAAVHFRDESAVHRLLRLCPRQQQPKLQRLLNERVLFVRVERHLFLRFARLCLIRNTRVAGVQSGKSDRLRNGRSFATQLLRARVPRLNEPGFQRAASAAVLGGNPEFPERRAIPLRNRVAQRAEGRLLVSEFFSELRSLSAVPHLFHRRSAAPETDSCDKASIFY